MSCLQESRAAMNVYIGRNIILTVSCENFLSKETCPVRLVMACCQFLMGNTRLSLRSLGEISTCGRILIKHRLSIVLGPCSFRLSALKMSYLKF